MGIKWELTLELNQNNFGETNWNLVEADVCEVGNKLSNKTE